MSSLRFIKRVTSRLDFECRHLWDASVAAVRGNAISSYWYRDVPNFGDLITPLLLRHYGCTPVYDRPARAQLVSTGSILEHLPDDFSGIILGSGFIDEHSSRSFPRANILAVRGRLTRERLGASRRNVALGDPGLLASRILPRRAPKTHTVGIIPHHSDMGNPVFPQLAARLPCDLTVIDVQQKPIEVFQAIDRCRHILSSSLHGLIVADALGIPSGWLDSAELIGGRFKFEDYYSSLGEEHRCAVLRGDESLAELVSLTSLKPAGRIAELQDGLHRLWQGLRAHR